MNDATVLKRLETLKAHFDSGDIPVLHQHEVNPGLPPGSRENYLYFVMTCSLNFQRSSPATWKSALDTWNDEETRFVFFPEKVARIGESVLRASLLKHKLALQPNRHTQIWRTISGTFHEFFQDDPRRLFEEGEYDAEAVLNVVQKKMKKEFPYLSGPKLSNYFIFILLAYSDLKLRNTHLISIIPDTHIMRATTVLGMLPQGEVSPKSVEKAWRDLLENTDYSPIDFHSLLWNWSRNRFEPKV